MVENFDNAMPWLSQEAPRYTSYPSAHHFYNLGHTDYENWLRLLPQGESVAIYVHIPFCPQLCWFCGCHTKATRKYKPVAAYIDLLLEEFRILAMHLQGKPFVHNIHFGGGSPTILSPKDLTRIFYAIDSNFNILPDAEISIEIDPRQLTSEKAKAYSILGFNRASIGVQDFDIKVQETINRIQPYESVASAFAMLRKNGIKHINADLVYGLPFQTLEGVANTATKILELSPSRISYFSYAHVPWVKKHQTLIPTEALPDVKSKAEQYLTAKNIFENAGYKAVGMDHFAKPEDDLYQKLEAHKLRRNFMGYSTLPNDNIIGLGVSSVSELPQGLCQNTAKIEEYQKYIKSGILPIVRGWQYNKEDYLHKEVITQLMCYFSADLDEILSQYNYPETYFDQHVQKLAAFEDTGIVSIKGNSIEFNSDFKMLIRLACAAFDKYAGIAGKKFSKIA